MRIGKETEIGEEERSAANKKSENKIKHIRIKVKGISEDRKKKLLILGLT
jgi:hypothetical protein